MNTTWEEEIVDDNLKVYDYLQMGLTAIPLILSDLEKGIFGWQHFLILRSLTKHTIYDPGDFPIASRGNFDKMKDFWLQWGKEKKFIYN